VDVQVLPKYQGGPEPTHEPYVKRWNRGSWIAVGVVVLVSLAGLAWLVYELYQLIKLIPWLYG
jgi:hypothetical protein